MRKRAVRGNPEAIEQTHILKLLVSLGGKVYVAGTTRPGWKQTCQACGAPVQVHMGTCQTPGIPDLPFVFLPFPPRPQSQQYWIVLAIEAKAPQGRFSEAQREFRDLCEGARMHYVGGGLNAVMAWLVDHGYLLADNVPHYRRPA